MMMMDPNQDNDDDDDDSDRTESYTPPPLDITKEHNSSEKENHRNDSYLVKQQQSIIVLDDSFEQITNTSITSPVQNEPINNYWDQWPLINDEERLKLYSIPDIDIPPSPPPLRSIISSSVTETSTTSESNILDILTRPSSLPRFNRKSNLQTKKPITKRKKKKKSMSEYRPPSPFSPKPDYKSMDPDQLKKHAIRYGLSTTQSKGRLIKILDEIYNFTHQYETDTDYEFDSDLPKESSDKKELSHAPPTPAIKPDIKKSKKRQAIHQMSSSDDPDDQPPVAKKPNLITTADIEYDDQSDDEDDVNHQGRFLELTVHELSTSTTSSSSLSIIGTPPTTQPNDGHLSDSKKSSIDNVSQSSTTKKPISKSSTPTLNSDSDAVPKTKKRLKRPKLETPTIPLKEIVRNYIESNPVLHSRVLCYEPIDFEEFHKQIKTDLNLKIVSKELMQCLDDQCITFTLRARKGAFTSVMRAKRRK